MLLVRPDFYIYITALIAAWLGTTFFIIYIWTIQSPTEKGNTDSTSERKTARERRREQGKKEEKARTQRDKNEPPSNAKIVKNEKIYQKGLGLGGNNLITRHQQETCLDLYLFDKSTPLNKRAINLYKSGLWNCCYGCNKLTRKTHPVYLHSCNDCGKKFQELRHLSRDLKGQTCLVTGGRTKLGHQIVMKLVRAGADVIITTRKPSQALSLFRQYPDYEDWKEHLHVYTNSLDFDTPHLENRFRALVEWIDEKFGCLDVLVHCAAQTIRVREKPEKARTIKFSFGDPWDPVLPEDLYEPHPDEYKVALRQAQKGFQDNKAQDNAPKNRYLDSKFVSNSEVNSWSMEIEDIPQDELEEVLRINSTAPLILTKVLLPLMTKSKLTPYIINVHAREGLFNVKKSRFHIHTNMAKAALSMFTKCLLACRWKTDLGKSFRIHGCDPGWISVDEYYEHSRPFVVPPLDEIDGAARILYPLFRNLHSCGSTRRHFDTICV